jgi:hypothetical protein
MDVSPYCLFCHLLNIAALACKTPSGVFIQTYALTPYYQNSQKWLDWSSKRQFVLLIVFDCLHVADGLPCVLSNWPLRARSLCSSHALSTHTIPFQPGLVALVDSVGHDLAPQCLRLTVCILSHDVFEMTRVMTAYCAPSVQTRGGCFPYLLRQRN